MPCSQEVCLLSRCGRLRLWAGQVRLNCACCTLIAAWSMQVDPCPHRRPLPLPLRRPPPSLSSHGGVPALARPAWHHPGAASGGRGQRGPAGGRPADQHPTPAAHRPPRRRCPAACGGRRRLPARPGPGHRTGGAPRPGRSSGGGAAAQRGSPGHAGAICRPPGRVPQGGGRGAGGEGARGGILGAKHGFRAG